MKLQIDMKLQHPRPVGDAGESPRHWRGVAVCTHGSTFVARVTATGPSAARIASSLVRECQRLWLRQRASTVRARERQAK